MHRKTTAHKSNDIELHAFDSMCIVLMKQIEIGPKSNGILLLESYISYVTIIQNVIWTVQHSTAISILHLWHKAQAEPEKS